MLAELVKRNAELEEELRQLRAVRDTLQSEKDLLVENLKRSEMAREYLAFQMEKLRRLLFGRRSEKVPARTDGSVQLELFQEAEREIALEVSEEREVITYERKKRRGNRRPIPEAIHREKVEIDVDPELRKCPECGEEMVYIGNDVSEDLDYIPALLFVVEYVLKKYACKKCQNGVLQAKRPPQPIPKARPAAGLLAYILVSKYQDHLPLHRIERIFSRHGMEISRKTLCDWVQAMAKFLRPIVEAMKRDLLRAPLLQADETPVQVKDPRVEGKTSRNWIWTYGVPDGEVVYDFTKGRSAEGPGDFLGEYSGYLQSDSYSVYTSLDRGGRIVHLGCWSHARRRFYDAREEQPEFSQAVIGAIQKLFRIEREAKEQGIEGTALVALRRQESFPILKSIRKLLQAKRPLVLPESGTGDAISYTLRNWRALIRYVFVPEACIDNNGAERSLRGVVLGRKNWLWIGHPDAGPRAAVIFSLVETCRRLGIEPFEYLRSVIGELAKDPDRAAEFTPRKWLETKRAASLPTSENPPPGHAP